MPTQRITFTEWTPDQPSIVENLSVAKNVVPSAVGYIPFPTAANYSTSASETLNNVFAARLSSTTNIFAGGSSKLFKFDSSDLGLDDVSKSVARSITNVALTSNVATITTALAHGYSTGDSVTVDASNNTFDGTFTITGTPTSTTFTYAKTNADIPSASATGTVIAVGYSTIDKWNFVQFGNTVLAANNENKIQSFTLGSSTYFGDVSVNAPVAKYITIVRDFVVAANLNNGENSNQLAWSDINDETDWIAGGASQSDTQTIPDGGNIQAVSGGEFGLVLLDRAIVRMTYIGSPFFFQFDTIARGIGCVEGSSVVQYANTTYFLGEEGFYSCDGQSVTPIGNEKIDRWFYSNANPALLNKMSTAVDPLRKIVVWNFVNIFGGNSLLIYNWQVQKWSYCDTDVNYIANAASAGTTIEGLDSIYNVTAGSFTAGKQYTITSVGTTDFTLIGAVESKVGVRFTASGSGTGDGTAVDLEAAQAAARTLDTLASSLDSGLWSGGKYLFAGVRDTRIITFTGSNLTAQLDTGLFGSEYPSVVTLARPLVDSGSADVAIASQVRLNQVVDFGAYTSADSENRVSLRSAGKYHKLSIKPTGDSWSNIIGVDIEVQPQGTR